jgi:hypothetical protein
VNDEGNVKREGQKEKTTKQEIQPFLEQTVRESSSHLN